MKILALGDPHGKLPRNLDSIIKKNKIDIIICVGDIPPFPKELNKLRKGGKAITFPPSFVKISDKSYKEIIKKICSYDLPVLVLRGNMYLSGRGSKITKSIFSKYKNLYYKKTGKIKIMDKNFIFFDMIWEKHMYDEMNKKSKKFASGEKRGKKLNNLLKKIKDPLLISHSPPYGCLDVVPGGKHVGSKIILKLIRKYKPKIVLCGHIHESKGKKNMGRTKVYNLGSEGSYEIINI